MKRDDFTFGLIALTFLGMVGLYVGIYLAWQKWQEYQPAITNATNTTGNLMALLGGSKT